MATNQLPEEELEEEISDERWLDNQRAALDDYERQVEEERAKIIALTEVRDYLIRQIEAAEKKREVIISQYEEVAVEVQELEEKLNTTIRFPFTH
jgi:chromosome segregation ATPase